MNTRITCFIIAMFISIQTHAMEEFYKEVMQGNTEKLTACNQEEKNRQIQMQLTVTEKHHFIVR